MGGSGITALGYLSWTGRTGKITAEHNRMTQHEEQLAQLENVNPPPPSQVAAAAEHTASPS